MKRKNEAETWKAPAASTVRSLVCPYLIYKLQSFYKGFVKNLLTWATYPLLYRRGVAPNTGRGYPSPRNRGEGWSAVLGVRLLAAILLVAFTLVSCGGQDTPVEQQEKEAGVEEESPKAPVESLPSYDPGPDTDSEICQVEKAIADLGPEGAQRLTDELLEAVRAGEFANMQEAYAARGYTCDEPAADQVK